MRKSQRSLGRHPAVWFRRAALVAVVGAGLGSAAPTAAEAAWCATYQHGGTNCGFATRAQCMAAISGAGGSCSPTGEAVPPREVERAPRKAVKPKAARPNRAKPAKPAKPATRKPDGASEPAAVSPAPQTPPAAAPSSALPAAQDFAAARKLVLEGRYATGLAALRALKFDDHPEVAAYIGLAHRRLGRVDEAKTWYERALAADPGHALALSFYGIMQAETGDVLAAREKLSRIGRTCTDCGPYRALEAVIAARGR